MGGGGGVGTTFGGGRRGGEGNSMSGITGDVSRRPLLLLSGWVMPTPSFSAPGGADG